MNNFEKDRIESRNTVGRQKEVIADLLELAQRHTGLFDSATIKQLRLHQAKCEKLYKKLDKNEFEIAIVGLEKAGKSTFGNALMENRILPDADERCTYTSTCIRYGQEDRAVVRFFSSREMDEVLRGYLKTLGVENVDAYTYQALSKGEYLSLFAKLDQRDQDRYENTVHQDVLNLLDNKKEILSLYIGQPDRIFEGEDLYQERFKSYIVSPKVAVAVKEVVIEASRLGKLQNAVIYDVPGFDSPTSMHLEQTKERMKEADAIMLIASAEKPSFTAPALNMFQEVVDEDNVSLADKLFIFGNRADAANTLGKNIQTLRDDAMKWKLLSRQQLNEKLMVGSAKAHLQKLGLVDGDFCIRKIEEDKEYHIAWPYGDGIEYAYEKLAEYNEKERFPIIKKKIKRNNEALFDIFKELKEKYDGDLKIDHSAILAEASSLKFRAKKKIRKELEELRFETVRKYRNDLALSRRLQEEVSKLFEDTERYAITEEDIHNAELKIDDAAGCVNVEKVEEDIREAKFNLIYGNFSESAFAVAQNDHSENYTRIVESFENAVGIHERSENYEKLHQVITSFVETCKKSTEDEFIYQSIIERFVRDVVEVLIRMPYSSEARLNRFVHEAEVFSGLVMFYNSGDANEGYQRQFLSVAPKNQPLLLALVFHDYLQSDESSKSVMGYIGSICNSLCENPEVVQLVFSIVKQDPVGGADAIRKMVLKENCKNCKSDEDYARTVIPALRKVKAKIADEGAGGSDHSTKKYDFDFTNKSIFERQYKQFFGNMPVRSYDDVREFFKVDLEILEKFLIHASIPAIRLEKPFVAREVQSINKLIEKVESEDFEKMINENVGLLFPRLSESENMAVENYIANKEVVAEAEKILKILDGAE